MIGKLALSAWVKSHNLRPCTSLAVKIRLGALGKFDWLGIGNSIAIAVHRYSAEVIDMVNAVDGIHLG